MTTIPRKGFLTQLSGLTLPNMQSFLKFVEKPDARGAMPCWGAISERFEQQFPSSSARLAVWRELVELGDRRPQLLFIELNSGRPEVLEQVVADAERLPEPVQRVLVTSEAARPFVLRSLAKLAPSARQLLDQGPEALERERRLQRRVVQKLRQIRFFAPNRLAPEDELHAAPAESPRVEAPTPAKSKPEPRPVSAKSKRGRRETARG